MIHGLGWGAAVLLVGDGAAAIELLWAIETGALLGIAERREGSE